ncbi:hypothetical protein SERLA73DRAFT_74545 [Serpula lacrymans var. lacrymans S7.3]|uniref:Uncharacterized protein n=1 Tax=Serpula lacrymans var. lacrymans (strain S7.3) TaxID=936435 RepID=F8PZJ5_SERL3|nr:hypothetical protein SERLA73DRAFT_74545 [Serpula lacrymans var. lacrymans S7.3]
MDPGPEAGSCIAVFSSSKKEAICFWKLHQLPDQFIAQNVHVQGVPAVIFVWFAEEPYREYIELLSQSLSGHDFEVSLAVRVHHSAGTSLSAPQSVPPAKSSETSEATGEEDGDIDEYLSSHGFEFIDIREDNVEKSTSDPHLDARTHGIPGLSRIIDALSTIMWPSMVQNSKAVGRTSRMLGAPFIGDEEELSTLINTSGSFDTHEQKAQAQVQREALERWLEEGGSESDSDNDEMLGVEHNGSSRFESSTSHNDDQDMWGPATSGSRTPHPEDQSHHSGFPPTTGVSASEFGFEDDFTVFLSAPSVSSLPLPQPSPSVPSSASNQAASIPESSSFGSTYSFESPAKPKSGRSTPTMDDGFLAPHSYSGIAYKSLGSVSDFGEENEQDHDNSIDLLLDRDVFGSGESDDDDVLPSKAEIRATSQRIFGSLPISISPTDDVGVGAGLPDMRNAQTARPSGASGPRTPSNVPHVTGLESQPFDLTNVLGVLQGLKEEIAQLPDEERRKAAARVALGFAYGLDDSN